MVTTNFKEELLTIKHKDVVNVYKASLILSLRVRQHWKRMKCAKSHKNADATSYISCEYSNTLLKILNNVFSNLIIKVEFCT